MSDRSCSIAGCERKHLAKGWCSMHYNRWRKHGDPLKLVQQPLGKECKVEGCTNAPHARGWCPGHYSRWSKHGDVRPNDPLLPWGVTQPWIIEFVKAGDFPQDCVRWPFGLDGHGYGMCVDGEILKAHRAVCARVHGHRPSDVDVAHSCGNRACVNPNHLRWASRSDNFSDKFHHKTHGMKYTEAEVRSVLDMSASGLSIARISNESGMSKSHVRRIIDGKTWKMLTA